MHLERAAVRVVVLLAALLGGCGKKGPLYLPARAPEPTPDAAAPGVLPTETPARNAY